MEIYLIQELNKLLNSLKQDMSLCNFETAKVFVLDKTAILSVYRTAWKYVQYSSQVQQVLDDRCLWLSSHQQVKCWERIVQMLQHQAGTSYR